MRYHDRIACALAGRQAQRRVAPQSVKSRDANDDEAIASELLLRLHGEERERNCAFKYLEARARNLVNHHWRMVEDLAKALLERQSLTGKEVGDVLRKFAGSNAITTEANTMNNKEYLEMELRLSVQKFGENDPVTLGIKRQLQEIEQRILSGQNPEILQFQAGFRKGRKK